ncbi:MAG: hypothetical protein FWE71_08945 [Nocardioidaceae bacterium]|nr:hypothetical protein [Nocardioidaceae bacterium]MCL2612487.1 hypothetical protein [Nocardioidaceae bacterium]
MRTSGRLALHQVVVALLAALAVVVVVPRPADAALLAQFRTVVTGIQPKVAGVSAKAAPNGESITVTNTTSTPLYVDGYQHEPYLKITDHGVWQNKLSPATYLNKEQTIGTLPQQANADKPPVWVRIASTDVATWHDHRIHWMGSQEPPVTQSDPGHSHLINKWSIPTEYGKRHGAIVGTLTWYPGVHLNLGGLYLTGVTLVGILVGIAVVATLIFVAVVGRRRRRRVTPT